MTGKIERLATSGDDLIFFSPRYEFTFVDVPHTCSIVKISTRKSTLVFSIQMFVIVKLLSPSSNATIKVSSGLAENVAYCKQTVNENR